MNGHFWAKCTQCQNIWSACELPVDMREFSKIMRKATCSKCGAGPNKITPAKQRNGILLRRQYVFPLSGKRWFYALGQRRAAQYGFYFGSMVKDWPEWAAQAFRRGFHSQGKG